MKIRRRNPGSELSQQALLIIAGEYEHRIRVTLRNPDERIDRDVGALDLVNAAQKQDDLVGLRNPQVDKRPRLWTPTELFDVDAIWH